MSGLAVVSLTALMGALAAVIAVRGALAWLTSRALLDHPNDRSSHVRPTPRGGGLGLIPAIVLVWLGMAVSIGAAWQPAPLGALVAAIALVAAVSFVDDMRGLPALPRLAVQLLAAALTLPWLNEGGPVFQGLLPPMADRALSILLLVGFINFFNFMDGIDGISGIEAGSIGLGTAAVLLLGGTTLAVPLAVPLDMDPALVLAASVLGGAVGFLVWNWHPARLFLGDVGSVPLGLICGLLCLILAQRGAWAAALILPSYYLADAGLTLLRRLLRGERIWQAHREHFYQRASAGGMGHARVAGAVALAQGTLIGAALLSVSAPWPALAIAAVTVLALLAWMERRADRGAG